MRVLLISLAALLITGCASSAVVVGKVRPPLEVSQVKIYLHPPKKYEEVALVEANSKAAFAIGSQAKTNVVIERLKEEAAKIGANGVLLSNIGDQATGSVGTAYGTSTSNGTHTNANAYGVSDTVFRKSGSGLAIFVEEE
jgi:hypothetical protein